MYYIRKISRWAFLAAVAFAAWKVGPVYASAIRFKFAVSEVCKTGATGKHSPDLIQEDILFRARELELPVRSEDVSVQISKPYVKARVDYRVPVELGPQRVMLKFHAAAEELPMIVGVDSEERMKKVLD